jgi:hypothetical protein
MAMDERLKCGHPVNLLLVIGWFALFNVAGDPDGPHLSLAGAAGAKLPEKY